MIKLMGRASWTFLSLLYAGFLVLVWCLPTNATELKDIRVGEYAGFTRIVFELDGPTANPGIKIQSSSQLLVTFNNTKANLVRQIPVERSPHVDEIQFWHYKAALSTLLIFDYPHIRFESFRLSRPPRYAVDVFPVAKPIKEKNTSSAAPKKKGQTDDKVSPPRAPPPQVALIEDTERTPAPEKGHPTTVDSENDAPSQIDNATATAEGANQQMDKDDENLSSTEPQTPSPPESDLGNTSGKKNPPRPGLHLEKDESILTSEQKTPSPPQRVTRDAPKTGAQATQPALPRKHASEPLNVSKLDNDTNPPPPPKNRLQFYLVIILVIITIAILLLLLLMLLTRHQLFVDKDVLSTAQISQQQDKNIIAKLDSNIKQQLKRYDEA